MIALAIDPFGGLARMTSGDSKRVAPKPADMIPPRSRPAAASA
jgi:hypothetical protein